MKKNKILFWILMPVSLIVMFGIIVLIVYYICKFFNITDEGLQFIIGFLIGIIGGGFSTAIITKIYYEHIKK